MISERMKAVFAARLKEAVGMSGLSYSALAEKLGVNKATVSMYVHAKALPSLPIFWQMTEILDVSADFLLGKKDI